MSSSIGISLEELLAWNDAWSDEAAHCWRRHFEANPGGSGAAMRDQRLIERAGVGAAYLGSRATLKSAAERSGRDADYRRTARCAFRNAYQRSNALT